MKFRKFFRISNKLLGVIIRCAAKKMLLFKLIIKLEILPQMQWPPTIDETCESIEENYLTLFVDWLKSPNKKESILQSLINWKKN